MAWKRLAEPSLITALRHFKRVVVVSHELSAVSVSAHIMIPGCTVIKVLRIHVHSKKLLEIFYIVTNLLYTPRRYFLTYSSKVDLSFPFHRSVAVLG